jgi:hypothetical protein
VKCPVQIWVKTQKLVTDIFWGLGLAQVVGRRLSLRRPGFNPRSVHVRFVVDKVAL